mmetsp:Transcript_73720/g.193404  ORF Transcript_73720/g.193404 Transcript_73720/m.193404 type:complete len:221 (-) Transcript_73720:222-884(-)
MRAHALSSEPDSSARDGGSYHSSRPNRAAPPATQPETRNARSSAASRMARRFERSEAQASACSWNFRCRWSRRSAHRGAVCSHASTSRLASAATVLRPAAITSRTTSAFANLSTAEEKAALVAEAATFTWGMTSSAIRASSADTSSPKTSRKRSFALSMLKLGAVALKLLADGAPHLSYLARRRSSRSASYASATSLNISVASLSWPRFLSGWCSSAFSR